MTLPAIDYFIGVKLTLKLKKSPHTTKVVYFTNRPDINTNVWAAQYWPIIESMPRLGVEAGDVMPDVIGGGIVLDNTIGSFGYRRKFSDLLERYAAVKGVIEVYVKAATVDSGAPSFDSADLQWSGQVQSVGMQHTKEKSSITLNVDMELIPDRRMSLSITSDMFPDCPEENLGKVLPVIASSGTTVYVPGYRVTATGINPARYAYATDLSNENTNLASETSWFVESADSHVVEITSSSPFDVYAGLGTASTISMDRYQEQIWEIPSTSDNHLATGVRIYMEPSGSAATTTARLVVKLYQVDADELTIQRVVASGGLELSGYSDDSSNNYDTLNAGATSFQVPIRFDRAAVLDRSRYRYALGFACTNWQATDASYKTYNTVAARWHRDVGGESYDGAALLTPYLELYYAYVSNPFAHEYSTSKEGFRVAYVELATTTLALPIDAFDDINPIIAVQGLRDDAAGSITSSASGALPRVHHFLEAITQEYDGSTWEPSTDWDFDTYAAQYNTSYAASGARSRILQGYVDGDASLFDMIEQICRDAASKVGITSSGKLFPFPWGAEQTVQLTIPPYDIEVLGREIEDLTTVVNRVTIAYTKSAKNMRLEKLLASNQQVNYEAILDWSSTTNGLTTALGAESVALYGTRPLDRLETSFIGDDTSAETLAESYFARFNHPMILDSVSVPWDYKALQMFHVIKYAHPMLDTYHGGHSSGEEPVDSDGLPATLKHGHYWYSAKTYRGLILGRYLVLPTNGGLPRLELKILVLQNYPGDPT